MAPPAKRTNLLYNTVQILHACIHKELPIIQNTFYAKKTPLKLEGT